MRVTAKGAAAVESPGRSPTAVRAQLLDARRPASAAEVIDELTVLNIDPTNAIALEDLILWTRLGNGQRAYAVEGSGRGRAAVLEHDGMYRAIADLPLYRAYMATAQVRPAQGVAGRQRSLPCRCAGQTRRWTVAPRSRFRHRGRFQIRLTNNRNVTR